LVSSWTRCFIGIEGGFINATIERSAKINWHCLARPRSFLGLQLDATQGSATPGNATQVITRPCLSPAAEDTTICRNKPAEAVPEGQSPPFANKASDVHAQADFFVGSLQFDRNTSLSAYI